MSSLNSRLRNIHPMRHYVRLSKMMGRTINGVRLKGDAVFCPCCERSAREFVQRDICAFCESRPRQRFLWLYLQDLLSGGGKILHFAPEECLQSRLRKIKGIMYVSADIRSVAADHNVDLNSPAETVKRLGAGAYSVVIISHVLEHVENDANAMQALRLLTVPHGHVLIQVPMNTNSPKTYEDWTINTPEGRLAAFGQDDHVRLYGLDFVERLESAGLNVTQVDPVDICSPEDIYRMRLKNDTIFDCRPLP